MRSRYFSLAIGTLIVGVLLLVSVNGRSQTKKATTVQRTDPRTTVVSRTPVKTFPPAQQNPQILATKRSPVQVGEVVGFYLEPEGLAARSHFVYEVDFGDAAKETIDRNRQLVEHRYKSAGNFKVSVNALGFAGAPPVLAAIASTKIEVVHATLSVEPSVTEVGVPVTLKPASVSKDRTLRYRFIYGDGNQSNWREPGEMGHVYSAAGDYTAKVEVAFTDNLDPLDTVSAGPINVKAVDPAAIGFVVNPTEVNANQAVTLSTRFDPKGRHIQYRFFYGDGKDSGWQDEGRLRYTYQEKSSEETYQPYVAVGFLMDGRVNEIATSDTQAVRVLAIQTNRGEASPTATVTITPPPVPPTPPTDWIKLLILILVGLVVIGGLVGVTRTLENAFSNPKPTFVASADAGTAQMVQSGAAPLVNFELHLDPNLRDGRFDLITDGPSLIRNERSQS